MILTFAILHIAQAATSNADSGMMSTREFNPVLLAQLVQLFVALGGIGLVIKLLKRTPPLGEELAKINLRIETLEKRQEATDKRLQEGDGLFRKEATDNAAQTATLEALKSDMHTVKSQMAVILARLPAHH